MPAGRMILVSDPQELVYLAFLTSQCGKIIEAKLEKMLKIS
jgi:hypothetical protein